MTARLGQDKGYLQAIAAVDPRLNVIDGRAQFVAELRRKGRSGPRIDQIENELLAEDREAFTSLTEDLDAILGRTEILFTRAMMPDDLPSRAPGLKWVHVAGAGLDRYTDSGIFGSNITLTNSRGAAAVSIAEHCLTFMFMFARRARHLLDNQHNRRWETFMTMELRGRVLAIIGLGAIGGEVARLARCIGMRVIATRKSAVRQEADVCGVDRLYPPGELRDMLREADFVIVAAPHTVETRGMIGQAELRAMKPTACFINIARGQIVQQSVLVTALKEGWIAGAGLDVFEAEPLPADSELWGLPNVIISSHNAAITDRYDDRVQVMFRENVRRYLAGEPLLNLIDTRRGY